MWYIIYSYVQVSCKYIMCETWLRGEEVSGDGDGNGKDDRVISYKIDDSSSGQFPLTRMLE